MTPPPEGVLPVDKPRGPTSHDMVARARKALGTRKIGHTGTLDPFATGLLLLCVGRSTRLAEYLTGMDKRYEAVARLGVATDTLDLEGRVVAESEGWAGLSADEIEAALGELRGPQDQVPPQFSAKKVRGEAMHRRARRGERVELEARPVVVHELKLLAWNPPELRFGVRCSSGTYIRALARDLGEALGVGAHLTELRRTAVGTFWVDRAVDGDHLETVTEETWISGLEAVGHLPRRTVGAEAARALAQGRPLPLGNPGNAPDEPVVAVACDGALVAIAEVSGGVLKPRKVLAPELGQGGDTP